MPSTQLWRQFKKNRAAAISLYFVIAFILAAIFASELSPYDPFCSRRRRIVGAPVGSLDGDGRSRTGHFSRVIHGTRVPLLVGFLATACSLLLGILIGSTSGYFGGLTDVILMRVTEYVLVVPRFFLALLVVAMLGTGIMKIVLVIGILGWPKRLPESCGRNFSALKGNLF